VRGCRFDPLEPKLPGFGIVAEFFKACLSNSLRNSLEVVLHSGIMDASKDQSVWQGRMDAASQFSTRDFHPAGE
jgi:hypothetical protein